MAEFASQQRVNGLNAKLHQGYDPNTEFKELGNLYGSVPYGHAGETHSGVLNEILQAIGNAVSNIFNRDVDSTSTLSLPAGDGVAYNVLQGTTALQPVSLANSDGNAGDGFGNGAGFAFISSNGLGSRGVAGAVANDAAQISISGLSPSNVTGGNPPDDGDPPGGDPDPTDPGPTDPDPTDPDPADPDGDLEAPVITAPPVSGEEDTPAQIALQIVIDADATATIITISGVPLGGHPFGRDQQRRRYMDADAGAVAGPDLYAAASCQRDLYVRYRGNVVGRHRHRGVDRESCPEYCRCRRCARIVGAGGDRGGGCGDRTEHLCCAG